MTSVLIVGDPEVPDGLERSVLWRESVRRRSVRPDEALEAFRSEKPTLVLAVARNAEDLEWIGSLREATSELGSGCVGMVDGDQQSELYDALARSGVGTILSSPYEPVLWESRLEQLLSVPARRSIRLPVRLRVWARADGGSAFAGTTVDLSVHGMLVSADRPVPIGSKLDVRLEAPGSDSGIEVIGEIVRHRSSEHGDVQLGIEFVLGREDARVRLARLCDPTTPDDPIGRPSAPPWEWERELRTSDSRLRSIVGSALDGILCFEVGGRLVEVNPAAERILGCSAEELASPGALHERLGPALRREIDEHLRRLIQGRDLAPSRPRECRLTDRTGRPFPAEATVCPGFARGRPFVTLWFRDLTDRRREERDREGLAARLAEKRRLESLGLLAGTVAHDFANLLTTIQGHAEMAVLELEGEDHPTAPRVRAVSAAAVQARSVVEMLRTYAGRRALTPEPIDLSYAVQQALASVADLLRPEIRIRTSVADRLPRLWADGARIQQILHNLVRNAVEALPPEGGTVEVEVDAGDDEPSAIIRIRVRDDGSGMSEAVRGQIFEPFFTTKSGGHGLGLAAVLGAVDAHGGEIRVRTAPGAGTSFEVRLPVEGTPSTS